MWYHDSRREGSKLEMNKKGELLCDSQTEKVTGLNIKIHVSDTYTELQALLSSYKCKGWVIHLVF